MDSYRRITSDQLREKQKRGESTILIDLRPALEFEHGHISGSINIPLETLKTDELIKSYEGKPLFLICGTGKRAYKAAELFYDSGFFDVLVVAGGLLSWRVLGFPLVQIKQ